MSLNTTIIAETFNRAKTENGGPTALGMRFYARLFEKYPGVKPLFHTPPEEQHKKLIASLAAIVASVTNTEKLIPYLHAMAVRHLKYGTENGHYDAVAENLIAVLGEHLSAEGEWTDDMKTAWQEALNVVNSVMIEAASNPEKFKDEIVAAGYQPDGFRTGDNQPWVMSEKVAS
ncbi:MAG: globin domain-containing protein [Candidatus Melainabacteria bacterium]